MGALSIASRVDLRCSLVLVIRSTSSIKLAGKQGKKGKMVGRMVEGVVSERIVAGLN